MTLSADRVLEQFLSGAHLVAQQAVKECYASASAESLQAILAAGMSVLMSESARTAICTTMSGLEQGTSMRLYTAMSRWTAASAETEISLPRRAESSQVIVGEITELCAPRLPETILHALDRLRLALTLGQTDEHTAFTRHAPMPDALGAYPHRGKR